MKKGFSTIEMMIAMVVMITAISAILMTSFGNQNFLIGSQTNSEAINKAKEILEIAQAESRKDFRMVNASPVAPAKSTDGYYSWWTDVERYPPSPATEDYFTKKVTSHVEWTDGSTITRNVKLSTLVSNFENAIGGDTCNSFLTGNWTSPQTTNFLFSSKISNDTSGLYPITDIEVYQKKIYVAVNQTSQVSGPRSGTSAISKTGVGTVAWSAPSNALNSGGSSATASLGNSVVSQYLWMNGYGSTLSIPVGATVLGIQVDVTRSASASGAIVDNQVKLIKSNGTTLSAQDRAKAGTWSSGTTTISYGNSTDLWGDSWTASDINNTNFGVAFSAKNSSFSTRTANIDYISVTVTYIKQLYVLDATTPTNPTRVSELMNGSTPSLGVGINAITTDGRYVYAAMNAVAGGQLEIIDVSTTPYTIVKTYSVPGVTGTQGVGKSIFYKDGYIYLGLATPGSGNGPELHILDVHNPSVPVEIGFWPATSNLGNDINTLRVRGEYLYISTPNAEELKVLDISNPSSPTLADGFDASDSVGNGKSLDLVGNTLYLGRTVTSGNPELYLVDMSDQNVIPTTALGTKEISSSINALFARDYLLFLATGTTTGAGQLQILNTTNKSNITSFATAISLPNTASGVSNESMDCEGNYIYVSSVPSSGSFLNKGSVSVVTAP